MEVQLWIGYYNWSLRNWRIGADCIYILKRCSEEILSRVNAFIYQHLVNIIVIF